MGERLKKYLKRMEERIEYLAQAKEDGDLLKERLAKEKAELLVQIGFFQHERLIHLIVTVLFALMTMLVFLLAMTNFTPWTGVLLLLLLALLIPYIRHYWLLENGTQKLYQYYDKMEEMYNGED
jgi:hypothetical protein